MLIKKPGAGEPWPPPRDASPERTFVTSRAAIAIRARRVHDALVANPLQARWWVAIAATAVIVGGCSGNKGEVDLLDVVHRTLPGVNILPGARSDSVLVQLPTADPSATELDRLSKELALPDDLYTRMTSSHDEAIIHTLTSECCVATWHWSDDDGYMLDVHLRGAEATLTTVQAPTPT